MDTVKILPVELETLFEAIDQSYEGLLLSDIDGRILYANQAVETISGFKNEEIIGKTPKEMEENGLIISQSMKILSKDPLTIAQMLSTGREVFITSKPVYDKNGRVICYIANYQNLTMLNQLHKEHHKYMDINYTELQQLRSQFLQTEDWIGNSYKMRALKDKIRKVANTDAIVLIMGESGVGKEIVSKNIHKNSNRKDHPYIQINCAAIPEALIESELFGYEKGAFTGAMVTKPGLLEAANGGTILLDEIGEMPLHLQAKLLRVIQTKEITRVGGTKAIQLDVRFLAATNRDLEGLVVEGKFREDLYYRLNVIPIHIPPLKERKEDIILLSQYFLRKFNNKYSKKKLLSKQVEQMLVNYHWPGNVRQLENTIEHLVILTEDYLITSGSLPREFSKDIPDQPSKEVIPLKQLRENTEIKMIRFALSRYKSIRETAKHLDVDHSTLVRKMKKYGM
jgi:PAS domain S-box-containing protein